MYSDQHTFLCSILDRNDRMTMGSSVECRVPFLDHRLVEGLASLPTRELLTLKTGKILLRRAVGHRLPQAVLRHPKWGFAVPWERYLRRTPVLRDLMAELPSERPFDTGPFDRKKMTAVIDAFTKGDNRHESLIRQFVMIAVWYRAVFAARGERVTL
jgi:asparagine synthase (glutamine-hydrolysing)